MMRRIGAHSTRRALFVTDGAEANSAVYGGLDVHEDVKTDPLFDPLREETAARRSTGR
jgi:hypothetical protein